MSVTTGTVKPRVVTLGVINTKRQPGDTPESAASRLRNASNGDDEKFIVAVKDYAIGNVPYVKQPYETKVRNWTSATTKGGDCSETARIAERMYKSQGIDARVVHGVTGDGIPHDTVEIHHNKRIRFFDEKEIPHFTKVADGFGDQEVLEPE